MTSKVFWEHPYATRHTTKVVSVNRGDITVDSTIFFAFSGGQESDMGTMDGQPVLKARKEGTAIIYTLPEGHDLEPGQTVEMVIDWTRRYRLMRLHFAAELVLELFRRRIPGIEKIGAHISQEKARIDFTFPRSVSPLLQEISDEANRIIREDLEVRSIFMDENKELRCWEIDGFARVPCGGTHLRRTGEIGSIRLKRDNIGRGKERVEIYLERD